MGEIPLRQYSYKQVCLFCIKKEEAKIEARSVGKPEISKIFLWKSRTGQNVALFTLSPTGHVRFCKFYLFDICCNPFPT